VKTIIAGSRSFGHPSDRELIEQAVRLSGFSISEVVAGMAYGIDRLAVGWALRQRLPIREFYANWGKFGRRAGYVRNIEMAEYGEALIAVWDGESKGTQHMVQHATKAGLQVFVLDAGL
jgi:hypothetical protein